MTKVEVVFVCELFKILLAFCLATMNENGLVGGLVNNVIVDSSHGN